MAKVAKAEREFLRARRLESGKGLSDEELDSEFATSRGPNREIGVNLRSQLFPLPKDVDLCCAGLFRYLKLDQTTQFTLAKALAVMDRGEDQPLETRLPVSETCG